MLPDIPRCFPMFPRCLQMLQDACQMPPDASQMPPDASRSSQMLSRCFPDASRCLLPVFPKKLLFGVLRLSHFSLYIEFVNSETLGSLEFHCPQIQIARACFFTLLLVRFVISYAFGIPIFPMIPYPRHACALATREWSFPQEFSSKCVLEWSFP